MPGLVYILCGLTSLVSAFLLWRSSRKGGGALLFWSSICFVGMALNNLFLYLDLAIPTVDLSMAPNALALVSVMVLLVALVWHAT